MTAGRYFCESCTRRYDATGDCADCPGEPLLDLADEEVRRMVQEFDDSRWRKRSTQLTFASIFLTAPVALPAMMVVSMKATLFIWGVAAVALSGVLIKKFAPEKKMPALSEQEIRAFQG